MGKYKLAGRKKTVDTRQQGALPCVIIVLMGIILLSLFFYFILKSSS